MNITLKMILCNTWHFMYAESPLFKERLKRVDFPQIIPGIENEKINILLQYKKSSLKWNSVCFREWPFDIYDIPFG